MLRHSAPTQTRLAFCSAAVACLVLLTAAASASAATFCVRAGSCHGTSEPDLRTAVAQSAKAGGGLNTILLGAGVFNFPGTADVKAGDPRVQIQGVGASTVLAGDPSPAVLRPVLELENASTVSGLTVKLNSGERLGLELSANSSARNVTVDGSQAAPGSVGVDLEGAASLLASTIVMSLADDQTFTFVGPTAVAVGLSRDGTIVPPAGSGGGTATIAGDALTGAIGLGVRGGAAHGQQLNIRATDDGALATGGSLTLDDALVQVHQPRTTGSAIGVGATQPFGQSSSPTLLVRNSTISGDNGQFSAGVFGGSSARVAADSVVLTNVASAIRASNGGAVAIAYSDFNPASIMLNGGSAKALGGNLNAAPGFVGGGNFALRAGSRLIDAGNPSEPSAGAPAVDLIGDQRVFGRHADIGACEYVGSRTPRCPGGRPISHQKPAPRLSLSGQQRTLPHSGRIGESVSCPAHATDRCAGTLTLATVELLGKKGHKRVPVVAGSARYSVAAGRHQTITIRVSGAFAKLLKRHGSLQLLAVARPSKRSEQSDTTSVGFLLVYKK